MSKLHKPGIIFQPTAYRYFQKGINQLLNAIRPTLGPYPRLTAYQGTGWLELLDDGGLIVRRIVELADRQADMGAMYVRQLLWQLRQKVGDGAATAAVLFQIIFNEGGRYVTAGGNAMLLRRHLEAGLQVILNELTSLTCPVQGQTQLAHAAESICNDPSLAQMLGEIFDIIGPYGQLEFRTGRTLDIEREYIEGVYFESGLLSPQMITDPVRHRTDMEQAAFLISDLPVEDPRDLLPILTQAVEAGITALVLIHPSVSELTVGLLCGQNVQQKIQVVAVKTPGNNVIDQAEMLQDLALLTGGQAVLAATGHTLTEVKVEDLGRARRAWATSDHFGLVAGQGDARALRQHVASLRAAFLRTNDVDRQQQVLKRIGRLLGGSAVLWIGGATETEVKVRQNVAERTAQAVRGALLEGVLPGGGAALLSCRPTLQKRLEQSISPDERAAYAILLRAVEEPARTLWANAGYEADNIMVQINRAEPGYGFDLKSRQVTDMIEAGVIDIAATQKEAIRSAVTGGALALTIDVLVHHKNPWQSLEP